MSLNNTIQCHKSYVNDGKSSVPPAVIFWWTPDIYIHRSTCNFNNCPSLYYAMLP